MTVTPVGINHIAIEVPDLDAALAWYGRYFALTFRGRRPTMAWIDLGDQFLALSQGSSGSPDRARHVGLVVDDKEALRDALLRDGVDVARSGSLRVHDPGGNQLEIVGYGDVQFSKTGAVLHGMGLGGLVKSASARRELDAKGMLGG